MFTNHFSAPVDLFMQIPPDCCFFDAGDVMEEVKIHLYPDHFYLRNSIQTSTK